MFILWKGDAMVGNHFCVYSFFFLFAVAASVVYGGEQCLIDHLKINAHDYSVLKKAVFAKKGQAYEQKFKELYPEPSAESVCYLAESFDEGSCTVWSVEGYVQVTHACIDGKRVKITGAIAEIVQLGIKTPPYFYWGY